MRADVQKAVAVAGDYWVVPGEAWGLVGAATFAAVWRGRQVLAGPLDSNGCAKLHPRQSHLRSPLCGQSDLRPQPAPALTHRPRCSLGSPG